MEAIATVISAFRNSAAGSNPLECALGVAVVIVVLRLELARNATNAPRRDAGHEGGGCFSRCKRLLEQSAPEVIGLFACCSFAAVLRVRGAFNLTSVQTENGDVDLQAQAAADAIALQWPMLVTADTLLALQAMLRVLVLLSSVLRMGGGLSLLSQEAAAIACGAAVGRVALASRSSVYMLDGPLGGNMPVCCEVLSAFLLLLLCRRIHQRALFTSVLTVLAASWMASRNQLKLADDKIIDGLFIFAHIAELIAAFAYLSRALVVDVEAEGASRGRVALQFAHLIMPVQACLSAYYFVQAFEVTPELVSVGNPFEILQWGCVAQVGAYAGAALLHWAECLESLSDGTRNSRDQGPRHAAVPTTL